MLQRGILSWLWSLYQHFPNTPGRRREPGICQEEAHTWHWPLCYHCWLMWGLLRQVLVWAIQGQLERTAYPVREVLVHLYQPSELASPTAGLLAQKISHNYIKRDACLSYNQHIKANVKQITLRRMQSKTCTMQNRWKWTKECCPLKHELSDHISSSTALRKKGCSLCKWCTSLLGAAQVKLTLENRALAASWAQHKPQEQIKGITLEW